ncbi:NAD-dependent epimerase/dehydratase family protein [Oceanithermus sp.]|uniref:NAD-dependent epimerase/dehydratase family protein n=1 Tax=Oceanithermus sp. TaxID=2268145 RepID=UPI002580A56E|nr:NAD-dependent epimerase/dehydratase family protein [Oceanithermus sp.]
MKVLVTGGAGFIGSHIVDALLEKGVDVAVLDDFSSGRRENLPEGVSVYEVDVRDPEAVRAAFAEFAPTHVSHQAAQISVAVSVKEPLRDASINVLGGLNVLEAAREVGVRHVVFASTGGAIYGEVPEGERADESWPPRPASPYAAAKAAFEGYLEVYRRQFGLRYTALRYGNVYGPRQDPHGEAGVVAIFARRLLAGKPVTVYARREAGDDGGVRDYVYVGDVVAANLMALGGDLEGVYNVGSGRGRSTREVLRAVARALGIEPRVEPAGVRPGDLERSVLDPSRLEASGWRAEVAFDEGIRRTVEWFKENAF